MDVRTALFHYLQIQESPVTISEFNRDKVLIRGPKRGQHELFFDLVGEETALHKLADQLVSHLLLVTPPRLRAFFLKDLGLDEYEVVRRFDEQIHLGVSDR